MDIYENHKATSVITHRTCSFALSILVPRMYSPDIQKNTKLCSYGAVAGMMHLKGRQAGILYSLAFKSDNQIKPVSSPFQADIRRLSDITEHNGQLFVSTRLGARL
ncbi:hypothetical protein CRM22_004712 [Opisthorchis felineus]|uniref:Uncharacterized protein n=1 Tax=Opisthorchis felineus TaxID=147828 RepID=A0A4S2M1H1_OPIFE|nr:hypothetical protein CRM22_004712 [Opisthorchis felineus]